MTEVQITVIAIDLVGIAIALGAVFMALGLKKSLGGQIGTTLTYFIWGILWMIASFVYTLLNARFDTALKGSLNVFGSDIHHALMVVGMIFFILSARAFTRLVQR